MKKLSFEKMEAIQGGGCLEIFVAWADANWEYIGAEEGSAEKSYWGVVAAVAWTALMECAIE